MYQVEMLMYCQGTNQCSIFIIGWQEFSFLFIGGITNLEHKDLVISWGMIKSSLFFLWMVLSLGLIHLPGYKLQEFSFLFTGVETNDQYNAHGSTIGVYSLQETTKQAHGPVG